MAYGEIIEESSMYEHYISPLAPPKSGGRLSLWLGILAAPLGIVAYMFQFNAGKLTAPWYAPALATIGAALILVSLFRRFTAWRIVALLLVGALTGLEWWGFWAMMLPAYSGPLSQGKAFPEFAAARADGTPFTPDDLKGDQDTALVFFRGHW
jgi:hypothetical protein